MAPSAPTANRVPIGDTRKPIRSAEAVAALRAASCRERLESLRNPDVLARHFVTRPLYRALLWLPHRLSRTVIERMSPGSYGYFLARTRFIDQHLLRAIADQFDQIVILGAGYDSRAVRFAKELGPIPVFEVDLEATQRAKRARLARLKPAPGSRIRFVPHDFTRGDFMAALAECGFDPGARTFYIWEGVSYYLPESSVRDVLERTLADSAPGSRMAWDYSLRTFVDGATDTYGGARMQAWLRKNREPFLFGIQPDQLPDFVKPYGLSVAEDLGPSDFSRLHLASPEGAVAGKPLGHLRMALLEKTAPKEGY